MLAEIFPSLILLTHVGSQLKRNRWSIKTTNLLHREPIFPEFSPISNELLLKPHSPIGKDNGATAEGQTTRHPRVQANVNPRHPRCLMMLVRTPFHAASESLFGYILRLSETNGYETPSYILRLAGFARPTKLNAAFSIKKLAVILGRNPDQLSNITYTNFSNEQSHFQILGHQLGDGLSASPLRLQHPAICPECVSDRGYIEAFFDLNLALACPLHGRELLFQCERCGNRLSHFRPGLLECRCGASFEAQIRPTVSDRIIALMAALKTILERAVFPSALSGVGLPIRELQSTPLRWTLANLPKFGRFNRASYPAHSLEVVDGIAEALENWPQGFYSFLEKYGHTKEAPSFHQRFAHFSETFFENSGREGKLEWLHSEFLHFGIKHAPNSFVDLRAIPGRSQERRVIPLRELSRRTGHDVRTLIAWGREGLLNISSMGSGTSRRYFVDTEALTRPTRSVKEKRLGKREAAASLGIPVSVLDCLRRLGQFPLLHHLASDYGFHETDLSAFRERLLAASSPIYELEYPDEVISLKDLLRTSRLHSAEHKTELIVDFLLGVLPSVGRTGETLDQIFFDKKKIAELATESRSVVVNGTLTHRQAAQMIGCDTQIISGLLNSNFIKSVKEGKSIRINKESIASFMRDYAPLGRYAEEWTTSSQHLKRLCNRAAIGVLDITYHNNCRSPFIRHRDVQRLREIFIDDRHVKTNSAQRESRLDPADQLREFLKKLAANDQSLPWQGCNANKLAIAKACGFDRDVFYTNEAAIRLLRTAEFEERLRRMASGESVAPPLARLQDYLDKLRHSGESLPMRGEKPNKSAIAKSARLDRDLFSHSDEAKRLIEAFLKENRCD